MITILKVHFGKSEETSSEMLSVFFFSAGKPIFSCLLLLVFLYMKLMDLPSAAVIEIQRCEVVK